MSNDIDSATFRHVLGHYPTGVVVITAYEADETPVSMVVGSFTSVSLDPPLVAFFPACSSTSWPRIAQVGKFCANILAADQEDVCRRLSSRSEEKFTGVPLRRSPGGLPLLEGAVAWIDCDVDTVHPAGDHFIVVGRVRALDVERPHTPLLFFKGSYGTIQSAALVAR